MIEGTGKKKDEREVLSSKGGAKMEIFSCTLLFLSEEDRTGSKQSHSLISGPAPSLVGRCSWEFGNELTYGRGSVILDVANLVPFLTGNALKSHSGPT